MVPVLPGSHAERYILVFVMGVAPSLLWSHAIVHENISLSSFYLPRPAAVIMRLCTYTIAPLGNGDSVHLRRRDIIQEAMALRTFRSRWQVLTGGPCSGKSTLLTELQKKGFRIVPESARAVVDQEMASGKTLHQVRSDKAAFQYKVTARQIKTESELPFDEMLFLDRALPDSIAYHSLHGLGPEKISKLCARGLYQRVFLLELLPFQKEAIRTEDPLTAARLHELIREAYTDLGYLVISVPVMSAKDRLRFVCDRL